MTPDQIRALQPGVDYSRRGVRCQTLVPVNGWMGEGIIRHECGDVVCVSQANDEPFVTWFMADQIRVEL